DDGGDPQRALRKGDLKFTLAGEKLQGGWVLVRMRRAGAGDRSSWLLIKHHDGYERADGHPVTDEDRSVASGRSMDEIAAGKGRRPKPFMLAGRAAAPDAVWNSKSKQNGKAGKTSRNDEARETSRNGKAREASSPGNVVLGTTISNPDKLLWPAEG